MGKDLGSGVIRGLERDHLAFRTKEVDWQILIDQGDRPYPCRYVITSTKVKELPKYTIDVRTWKTGADVPSGFSAEISAGAKKLNPGDLPDSTSCPASTQSSAQEENHDRRSGHRSTHRIS
jgi:hypothetical protein